ncbi:PP2C family serine/threonine-protein phosphatase [Xanthobacteraceae bacterium A53D]
MTDAFSPTRVSRGRLEGCQISHSSLDAGPFIAQAASVQGDTHIARDQPCEDAFALDVAGDWLFAVVSDGAGSAPHALFGARTICAHLVDELKDQAADLSLEVPERVEEMVRHAVTAAQEHCMAHGPSDDLLDYLATFVLLVLSPDGGFVFHVGDGLAEAFSLTEDGPLSTSVSPPENGEYANITYFFSEPDFDRHLRMTPLRRTDAVLLMTDGVTAFASPMGDGVRPAFAQYILDDLFTGRGPGGLGLARVLVDERARARSSDDKTLLAVRVRR